MNAEIIGSASECSSAAQEISKMLNDKWFIYQDSPGIDVHFEGEVNAAMEETSPKGCSISNLDAFDIMWYPAGTRRSANAKITVKWNNHNTGTPSFKAREICLSGNVSLMCNNFFIYIFYIITSGILLFFLNFFLIINKIALTHLIGPIMRAGIVRLWRMKNSVDMARYLMEDQDIGIIIHQIIAVPVEKT